MVLPRGGERGETCWGGAATVGRLKRPDPVPSNKTLSFYIHGRAVPSSVHAGVRVLE